MQIFGVILIFNALILGIYWITTQQHHVGKVIFFSGMIMLFGVAILIGDRLTEFSIKGIGSIKAAAKQAQIDAAQVQEIREKMEAQSHTVNLIAKEVTQTQEKINDVARRSDEAKKFLDELAVAQNKARDSQAEMESILNFMMIFIRAQNDDRKAYDELKQISGEPKNKWSDFARRAYATIMDSHSSPMSQSGFKVPWKEGVDPTKLTFDNLKATYRSSPPVIKPGLLEYIHQRADVKKHEKMQFFIDVMQTDESLLAVEYAGRYFVRLANLQIKPLAVDYLTDWWENNKASITD